VVSVCISVHGCDLAPGCMQSTSRTACYAAKLGIEGKGTTSEGSDEDLPYSAEGGCDAGGACADFGRCETRWEACECDHGGGLIDTHLCQPGTPPPPVSDNPAAASDFLQLGGPQLGS
jgi:hypothetical protein